MSTTWKEIKIFEGIPLKNAGDGLPDGLMIDANATEGKITEWVERELECWEEDNPEPDMDGDMGEWDRARERQIDTIWASVFDGTIPLKDFVVWVESHASIFARWVIELNPTKKEMDSHVLVEQLSEHKKGTIYQFKDGSQILDFWGEQRRV